MEAPHLAQQLGRRLPSRLILEIDVSQFLAGASQADLTRRIAANIAKLPILRKP
jgi:hypothetical protein